MVEDRLLTDKTLMVKDYVPSPFFERLMDYHEWLHILTALDVCIVNNGPQFCDDDDKEIIPIIMVNLTHYVPECEDFHLIRESISITNLRLSEESYHFCEKDKSGYVREGYFDTEDDDFVPEAELEKVRILL